MTQKEIKESIRKLEENTKIISSSKEKALEFLVGAGICNKDGNLTKEYQR